MANKSGRPIGDNMNIYYIKGINLVILTETEYNTLIKKYGTKIINKALMILDDWLKKSPIGKKYQGKNNYAHFRSDGWLINEAMRSIDK